MSRSGASLGARAAAFLDRDGTIIRDTEYIRDPDDVRLLPGAATAIRRLNDRSIPVIVITNQSGIARGLLTEQDYERVRMRVDKLLAANGARIDASYHCPHHPDFGGACDCRKPASLLFRRAAEAHGIDLSRSFYVGDRLRDVEPAKEFGGRGFWIQPASTSSDPALPAEAVAVTSLSHAVDLFLGAVSGPIRVAVLASGGGSNLQAILDHIDGLAAATPAKVVLVASDKPQSGALERARRHDIATHVLRDAGDVNSPELLDVLTSHDVDLVGLAGYLRMIPVPVVDRFADRMVNVHPALLPAHGGRGMYGLRVHQAVLDSGDPVSGATVHRVTHEYDRGAILAQWPVPVLKTDDAHALAERVLVVEHLLYPRVIEAIAKGQEGRFPIRPPSEYFANPPISPGDLSRDIIRAFLV